MESSESGDRENGYSAFVSYASANRESAETIAASLEASGLTCWIAPRNIRPGAEYGEEILRGIDRSKTFILVLSEAANLSAHVRREVERAASKGKAIYPVRIEDVPPSPKLEYFIAMHHWLDAWDGMLDEHGQRLAAAIASEEEWIGNKVIKRRRWVSGGVLTLVAGLIVAGAVIFGGDVRRYLSDTSEQARQELQDTGISVNAAGLADAVRGADAPALALFSQAGIGSGAITSAFSDKDVAKEFFENSKGNSEATNWLRTVLATVLDPNATVDNDYYEQEGLIRVALRAGNFDGVLALLDAGASPHTYQNLWFTYHELAMAVLPYSYIDAYGGFSAEEKALLAQAFIDAGAVIALPDVTNLREKDLSRYSQFGEALKMRDEIKSLYGLDVPNPSSICEAKDTPICLEASRRSGFDWCAFARALPRRVSAGGDSSYYNFLEFDLVQLINVVDDKAYILSTLTNGYRPGYGFIEISKDMKRWHVYKFSTPAAGMGHCKKDENGYQRDDCWRRVEFEQTEDDAILKMFDYYDYTKTYCE
jgi:hypothetical protein